MRADETYVDNIVGILHNFGLAYGLEINWHKSIAYWYGQGTPPQWVEKYYWKWAANRNMSKLLGTPFGLHLELQSVDKFMVNRAKDKLTVWNSIHLLLVWQTFIVNHVMMSYLWYFIAVWVGSKGVLGKIKAITPQLFVACI